MVVKRAPRQRRYKPNVDAGFLAALKVLRKLESMKVPVPPSQHVIQPFCNFRQRGIWIRVWKLGQPPHDELHIICYGHENGDFLVLKAGRDFQLESGIPSEDVRQEHTLPFTMSHQIARRIVEMMQNHLAVPD